MALPVTAGSGSEEARRDGLTVPAGTAPASVTVNGRAAAAGLRMPGVTAVLDLHIWAMGSNDVALTAHLIVPDRTPDHVFYETAHELLSKRFQIKHSTLQVVRRPVGQLCDL